MPQEDKVEQQAVAGAWGALPTVPQWNLCLCTSSEGAAPDLQTLLWHHLLSIPGSAIVLCQLGAKFLGQNFAVNENSPAYPKKGVKLPRNESSHEQKRK